MLERQTPNEESGEERAGMDAAERPAHRRRGWLSALVASVAVVAVVAVFGALALGRQGAASSQSALGSSAAPPADWKVYRDPLGLYSIRIPANWTATASFGSFTMGSRSGSFSGKSEDVQFSDPTQGKASARIEIHTDQINSAFGREWYCAASSPSLQKNSALNGYPADEFQPGTVWMLESYNAHFQIDLEIPGVIVPDNPGGPMIPNPPPPTPTPLPSSWVKADQAILNTALASFKPAAKPLTCG